jgi:hypothetical protein
MKATKLSLVAASFALALAFTFNGCSDGKGGFWQSSDSEDWAGVIPEEIYKEFTDYMPIYPGKTPPDISGQYLASPYVLVSCSQNQYSPGDKFGDRDIAFIKGSDGKLKFMGRQGGSTSSSEEVTVEVVGQGNNFTAYFIATSDETSNGAWSKQSILVSGTLTSEGISDFHYSFIMLEKNDPNNTIIPVNAYRVFKDSDGLAIRNNWLD